MAVAQQQPYSPQQDQSQQLAQAGVQPGGLFGTASGPSLAGGAGGVDFGTVLQKLVGSVFGTAPTQFGRQAPNIPPIQPKQQVPQMQTSEQVFPPGGGSANKRIAMNNMFKNAQAVVQTIDRNIEQKNIREMQVHFDRLFTAMNGVTEAQQVLKDPNSSPQMKQQAQQALQQNSGVVATMTDPNTPLGKKVHKELKNALDFNFVGEDKGADSVGRKAYQGVLQQQKQAVGNVNLNFNKPGVSAAQQGPQAIQQQQQQQAGQQRIQQLQQMMPQVLQQNPQWLAALGMLKAMKEGGITDLYGKQIESGSREKVAQMNNDTKSQIADALVRLHDRTRNDQMLDHLNKYFNDRVVADIRGEWALKAAKVRAQAEMQRGLQNQTALNLIRVGTELDKQQKQLEAQIVEASKDENIYRDIPLWSARGVDREKYKKIVQDRRQVIADMHSRLDEIQAQRAQVSDDTLNYVYSGTDRLPAAPVEGGNGEGTPTKDSGGGEISTGVNEFDKWYNENFGPEKQ